RPTSAGAGCWTGSGSSGPGSCSVSTATPTAAGPSTAAARCGRSRRARAAPGTAAPGPRPPRHRGGAGAAARGAAGPGGAAGVRGAGLSDPPPVPAAEFAFEQVPFDHPLWILFSSGTTGLPKAIVHSHGGILLEQMKLQVLHMDLRAGDRMFFFTTSGWMMWNFLVSSLLVGVCPVLYDGSPAYPGLDVLWRIAQECGVSFFGASPAY